MNLFFISGIFIFITSLVSSVFVLTSRPTNILKNTWILFSLSVCVWGLGIIEASSSSDIKTALFWYRFVNLTAITIPIFFLHFVLLFTNQISTKKFELIIYYVLTFMFFFSCFILPQYFVSSVSPKLSLNFYPNAGLLYYFFPLIFGYLATYGSSILLKEFQTASSIKKEQIKYILIGVSIGFIGGGSSFLLVFNIPVYPFGTFFVPVYVFTVSYAVARYRLMDIRLAVTNISIFLMTYSLVLGIPFYIYAIGFKLIALIGMFVLATAGPIIFNLLSRQAENKIFEEQGRYRKTILTASRGLNKIKTRSEIANMVVKITFSAMALKNSGIYLKDDANYKLFTKLGYSDNFVNEINETHPMIKNLIDKGPFLVDEMEHLLKNSTSENISLLKYFKEQDWKLIIPIIHDYKLLAILVLGEKRDGSGFSIDDLDVLNIISNNTAILIEYAILYENEEERRKREDVMARREFLDNMVSTMSHEINNPNQVVLSNVGLGVAYLEGYKSKRDEELIDKAINLFNVIEDKSLSIAGIIESVRGYSQEHERKVEPTSISDALTTLDYSWKLLRKKNADVELIKEIEKPLPLVLGNNILVQEIVNNFLSNAAYAAAKNNLVKPRVVLKIYKLDENLVRIEVSDNGCGIEPGVLKVLFQVPKTTKSHNDGTGLGLLRIRKICDLLGAKYWIHSDGLGKGARAWTDLQIAKS